MSCDFAFSSAPPAGQSVDFMTMTYGGSPVHRLSTASSVSKPPHFLLTTQWLWYWKDESGKWLEYGQVSQTITKYISYICYSVLIFIHIIYKNAQNSLLFIIFILTIMSIYYTFLIYNSMVS